MTQPMKAIIRHFISKHRIILLFLTGLSTILFAQTFPIQQDVEKPETLYIGTPFTLSINISLPNSLTIQHPVKDTLDVFTLLDYKVSKEEVDQTTKYQYDYNLAAFEVGEQRIPPLAFEVYDDDGSVKSVLQSKPVYLNIISVVADTSIVLKDIAPPLKVKYGFWDFALPIFLALAVIAIIYLIWFKFFKDRDGELIDREPIDTTPPYKKALQLLHQLREKKHLERGEYLPYYFQISYIVRYFWGLHFNVLAVEMTSSEILNYLKDIDLAEYPEIMKFLQETDLVKFAKKETSVNKAIELTEWLENYLKSFEKATIESEQ